MMTPFLCPRCGAWHLGHPGNVAAGVRPSIGKCGRTKRRYPDEASAAAAAALILADMARRVSEERRRELLEKRRPLTPSSDRGRRVIRDPRGL